MRQAAVCRELTKPYEEVVRGTLAELTTWAAAGVRGEITVVIAGAPQDTAGVTGAKLDGALTLVRQRVDAGEKLSAAVSAAAQLTGVRRKDLYEAALEGK
jgi:16S rRNA (cytidine1402-2'-O)-methyltransferase